MIRSAVVLAAGEGTRLRPLTQYRPKPLLPAATKPILEHVLDQLVDAGITNITVVVGYGRNRVQSHFGPTYRNVPLHYVVQENQLGTGHALLAAESAVADAFVVLNGDQIVDRRFVEDVIEAHERGPEPASGTETRVGVEPDTEIDGGPGSDANPGADAVATIGLAERTDVGNYGGVICEDGRVAEFVEDPEDDRDYLLNAGVYAFETSVFDAIRDAEPRAGEHLLVDGITQLLESDEGVRGVVSDGLWVDATYPWDLLDVSFELFEAGLVDGTPGDDLEAAGAIHDSAVIREPVVIDPDCEIGPGAVVGPCACLGENVTVGSNAVVEGSVIDRDTRVGANATVVDAVTGVGVEIGPGTTIPGGPGDVRVRDRVFEGETLGALLSDRVTDRGGATYVPGTIVGSDAVVESGTVVRGTLSSSTEVRS